MASFPLQDQPLVLPSRRVVRIYNLVFLTQQEDPSSVLRVEESFRIQYGTAIPADQAVERSSEAAEVIGYFLGEASAERSMVGYAEICSTPAQVARREAPEASFKFLRSNHGSWRLVNNGQALDPSA